MLIKILDLDINLVIPTLPDNGAILEPVIQGDEVVVKVIKPGLGFNTLLEVVSDTGYNAEFIPIFKIVDPKQQRIPETQIVQVTIVQVKYNVKVNKLRD